MAITTANLPGYVGVIDITTALASGSLTISSAKVFKSGTDTTIVLNYSDSTVGYIKFKATGRLKIGGADNTFGTGTEITWPSL